MDETSDNGTDRSVLNLVLIPMSASAATDITSSYIGDQIYVDKLDHKIIAAEVMKVVNKFEINHNDVIAYVSDSVAFTSKASVLICEGSTATSIPCMTEVT